MLKHVKTIKQKLIAQHDARLWVVSVLSDLSSRGTAVWFPDLAGDSSEQKTEESDKDKVSWWQHMAWQHSDSGFSKGWVFTCRMWGFNMIECAIVPRKKMEMWVSCQWWLNLCTSLFLFNVCRKRKLLVGDLEHEYYDFPYIGNFIIPTDFHSIIFQRGLLAQPPTRYMNL